jgi:cystathionine gamma-synthase
MSGFGSVITFGPSAGAEAAGRIPLATRLWLHATSLGGVESTLERRRRHPQESPATPPDLIRLSVGCEDVEDLWRDLDQAISAA